MEKYIEQTIKSIINQNYNNYEIIVVDAVSTDKTIEIVKRYDMYVSCIVSEPDKGQYDAINKGFSLASGDIFCWLNADDVFFPWTLSTLANIFNKFKDVEWISGMPAFLDEQGNLTNIYNSISAKPSKFIKEGWFRSDLFGFLQQESMFWRRSLWDYSGGLNINFKLAGDFELWTRFAQKAELVSLGLPLAGFRKHIDSRSNVQQIKYQQEVIEICKLKKQPIFIVSAIAKRSKILNRCVRMMYWQKSYVVFYSVQKQRWEFYKKRRPISNVSLTYLFLER